jgi:hypothetical protein
LSIYINLLVITKKCPENKIIYRTRIVEPNELDTQFSEKNNNLLSLYDNVFSFNNPYVGGTSIGIGKTKIQK